MFSYDFVFLKEEKHVLSYGIVFFVWFLTRSSSCSGGLVLDF